MKRIYFWLILGVISFFSCKKEVIQFSLNASASPIKAGTISPESGTYENGQFLNILATPKSEYLFKEWQGDLSGTLNPASVLMDKNKSILGVFERRQYPLNLTIEGSGSIKEEIIAIATDSQYPSGTTVKLSPEPLIGWKFIEWKGDIQSNDNPLTLIINQQFNLVAIFKILDEDKDGVNDILDKCPQTPSNEKPDKDGCSFSQIDSDGDGVVDIRDSDNNTRKGVPVDKQGIMLNPIYLDSNKVTIKAFKWAIVGDTGSVKGVRYTVVNEEILRAKIKGNEDVTKVVTSFVTSGKELFQTKFNFNQNIGSWDVSNFTDMTGMFSGIIWSPRIEGPMAFNQDISNWDVSNVQTMEEMFFYCERFNQNLNKWKTSSVYNMSNMFREAKIYNQPMDKWDVSNVIRFDGLFLNASSFNQNINGWNTSKGINFTGVFFGCNNFNQPLNDWNVARANSLSMMFLNCYNFNQPLNKWITSAVTSFKDMFYNCWSFNQPLENWDVASGMRFDGMFNQANRFDQPLKKWNVSNAISMAGMFSYSSFNQDISNWNVSQVINMDSMFSSTYFNQNLASWEVSKVTSCSNFAYNTPYWTLSKPNFKNCKF